MKSIPLNDLSRISDSEIDILTGLFKDICSSGQYLRGDFTRQLEDRLSNVFENRQVIAVANGTDALTLAVAALQLPPIAKVAVAPNAGGYGSIAARRLGLQPVFVDVEIATAQMDPDSLRAYLEKDSAVGAVIVTHLFGLCGRIEEIADICEEFSIPLIEDCAQSIGARVNSRPVGAFGSIATLSFYPTKNLGGMGDGGAVICSNAELAKLVSQLAQYGWGDRYAIEYLNGFNSRLDEIQAAIINTRLPMLDQMNSARKTIIERYNLALREPRRIIFSSDQNFVGHLAILVTPTRNLDAAFLQAEGISTGVHYPLLDPEQPAWSQEDFQWQVLIPNAFELNTQILTLPCFPTMTEKEIAHVCRTLSVLP